MAFVPALSASTPSLNPTLASESDRDQESNQTHERDTLRLKPIVGVPSPCDSLRILDPKVSFPSESRTHYDRISYK